MALLGQLKLGQDIWVNFASAADSTLPRPLCRENSNYEAGKLMPFEVLPETFILFSPLLT